MKASQQAAELREVRAQATHELKIWPEFFSAVASGAKKFELRKNDRDYVVGDVLVLKEWNPTTQGYTGRECTRRISYLMRGGRFDLPANLTILSLSES